MGVFGNAVRVLWAVIVVGVLAACGGGGGGSGAAGPSMGNGQVGGGSGSSAPRIQGTPRPNVAVGHNYSFQPTVEGADSGGLAFSARNLPAWLTLDAATGRVTGIPTTADIGSYSGITIVVSRNGSESTLGPFAIAVVAEGSGAASLSWLPPTQNTDGSALNDLAGFVILYGYSPDDLPQSIRIDNPSVSTYVVDGLTSGQWYFAVQAVNASGARGVTSGLATKTIG